MILLNPDQLQALQSWFLPDQPGPLVGLHVIQTGYGSCLADRWPDPRAILVETSQNYSLAGEPSVLQPEDLHGRIAGFVEAAESFYPLLSAAFPDLRTWDRLILSGSRTAASQFPTEAEVRRLRSQDAYHLWGLRPESRWIWKTWGSPQSLAASGMAWGAFIDGRLASVAVSFFVGNRYEDIGVVTEPEYRGRGLSSACASALAQDIQRRGRQPSWSTSTDNAASLRVAEKLGFQLDRRDKLYVTGLEIPEP